MSTLKIFLASLFAYAGILARRSPEGSKVGLVQDCHDAVEAGSLFVLAWDSRKENLPKDWGRPRSASHNPPPVEKAERPAPPPAAPALELEWRKRRDELLKGEAVSLYPGHFEKTGKRS